jgi:hypothetical protein
MNGSEEHMDSLNNDLIEKYFWEFWKENYIRLSKLQIKEQFIEILKAGILYKHGDVRKNINNANAE